MTQLSNPCILCGELDARHCITIRKKPDCETDYGIPAQRYMRSVFQCNHCGVFLNDHCLLQGSFYQGDYNESTYAEGWGTRYEYIMSLPFEKSDNKQRVARIHAFLEMNARKPHQTNVLDIGSGLGVFSAEMLKYGYVAHVVDPDPKSVNHALGVVGVNKAWQGSVLEMDSCVFEQKFDFISLNKVLEHVPNPLPALRSLHTLLADNGFAYVELPDGEAAAQSEEIAVRQEFCIEHLTVFGPVSMGWFVEEAGFKMLEMQRIHEPSGKFSIYAFLNKAT